MKGYFKGLGMNIKVQERGGGEKNSITAEPLQI
jgi:hypothetical protein